MTLRSGISTIGQMGLGGFASAETSAPPIAVWSVDPTETRAVVGRDSIREARPRS